MLYLPISEKGCQTHDTLVSYLDVSLSSLWQHVSRVASVPLAEQRVHFLSGPKIDEDHQGVTPLQSGIRDIYNKNQLELESQARQWSFPAVKNGLPFGIGSLNKIVFLGQWTFCSWNTPSCHVGLWNSDGIRNDHVDTPVDMYGVCGNVKAA